jgi:serine/threonine protein kinase
MPLVNCPLEL